MSKKAKLTKGSAEDATDTTKQKSAVRKSAPNVEREASIKRLLREISTTGTIKLDMKSKDVHLLDGTIISVKQKSHKLKDGRVFRTYYASIFFKSIDELINSLQKIKKLLALYGEKTGY